MSAPTNGPLKVVNGGLSQLAIVAKDGNAVAFVPRGHPDSDANANLFSAAPDLLAALKDCVAHMSGGEKSCGHQFECACVGRNAVAAIAKAEGRS